MKLFLFTFCALATTLVAAPRSRPPTPEQAVQHATSVVLVERAVMDNQIHSYVKEVWRSSPGEAVPAVGAEYGRPTPCSPAVRFADDMIVFEFGPDRPADLPPSWRVNVTDKKSVPVFLEEVPVFNDAGVVTRTRQEAMRLSDVRRKVKKTTPLPAQPRS